MTDVDRWLTDWASVGGATYAGSHVLAVSLVDIYVSPEIIIIVSLWVERS